MKTRTEFWPPHAFHFKVGGVHILDPIAGAAYESYKKPAGNKVNPPKAVAPPPPTPSAQLQAQRKKSQMAMMGSGSSGFYDNTL